MSIKLNNGGYRLTIYFQSRDPSHHGHGVAGRGNMNDSQVHARWSQQIYINPFSKNLTGVPHELSANIVQFDEGGYGR